jgi:hypothetical protein
MTNIALFIEGCDPATDTLEGFYEADKSLTPDQKAKIDLHTGLGIVTTFDGGPTPSVTIVSLSHRDGGFNAGEVLELDQMIQLWELYCELHGFPSKSADELLADLNHWGGEAHEIEATNWISAFIEGWDMCEARAVA